MNTASPCRHCGAPLAAGERFCTTCGQAVTAESKATLPLILAGAGVLMAFVLGIVLVVAWARLRPSPPATTSATTTAAAAAGTASAGAPPPAVDDNVVFELPDAKKTAPKTADPAKPPAKDYVLAQSAERKLTREEILALDPAQRRLARNEIFARHGYQFQSADLREYFGGKTWYKPNPDFSESALSAAERANAELIRAVEAEAR